MWPGRHGERESADLSGNGRNPSAAPAPARRAGRPRVTAAPSNSADLASWVATGGLGGRICSVDGSRIIRRRQLGHPVHRRARGPAGPGRPSGGIPGPARSSVCSAVRSWTRGASSWGRSTRQPSRPRRASPRIGLELDDYSVARDQYAILLERCERVFGPRHLDTLSAAHGLAVALSYLDRPEEARPLYERVVAGRTNSLGPEDPATLSALHNLGLTQRAVADDLSARGTFEALLEAQRKTLGRTAWRSSGRWRTWAAS
jgi:hypothetical protein